MKLRSLSKVQNTSRKTIYDESGPIGFCRATSGNAPQSKGSADLRRGSAEMEGAMPKREGRCRKDQGFHVETQASSQIREHGQSTSCTHVRVASFFGKGRLSKRFSQGQSVACYATTTRSCLTGLGSYGPIEALSKEGDRPNVVHAV